MVRIGVGYNTLTRFWDKVEFTTDCWEWKASKISDGYGQFSLDNRNVYAHRFSYELYKGKIPDGMFIDHLCRNPSCVNPKHLEMVTNKENIIRGNHDNQGLHNKIKTHCPQGHPYSDSNLYICKNERYCRKCRYYMKKALRFLR